MRAKQGRAPSSFSYRSQLSLTTLGTVAALLGGVLLQVVLAVQVGVTDALDRFLVATTLPTFIAAALGTASLQLLVPALHRDEVNGTREFRRTVRLLLVLSFASTVTVEAFAPFLLERLISNEPTAAGPDTFRLLRILALGIPVYTLASIRTAVHHSRSDTVRAALCTAVPPVVMAISALTVETFGLDALAWGQVIGYGLSVAALGGSGHETDGNHLRGHPSAGSADPESVDPDVLSNGFRPWWPTSLALVAGSVHLLMPLVERRYGIRSGPGTVAALGYASRLAAMTAIVASSAVGAMSHARLSRGAARSDSDELATTVARSLARVVILGAAAACILASSAGAVSAFLTGAREAAVADSEVATLIRIFAVAVVSMGIGEVVGRASFVLGWYRLLATIPLLSLITVTTVLAAWPGHPPPDVIALTEVGWWSSSALILVGVLIRRVPPLGSILRIEMARRARSLAMILFAGIILVPWPDSVIASLLAATAAGLAVWCELRETG